MQESDNGWGNIGGNSESTNNAKKATNKNIDLGSFLGIMTGQSLMSNTSGILEFKDIKKNIEESLKAQKSTATAEIIHATIPTMKDMSPEQSPHLPGIVLYTEINQQVFLMPCLFYKKDIAQDALETINIGNNSTPQTYHKFAEAFITPELREKVSNAFSTLNGKQMSQTFTISNMVLDVDMYLNSSKESESGIAAIANAVLTEWYNAIQNFTFMAVASTAPEKMPNPFREGHLLGSDDTAVARIDTLQQPATLDGHPVPYNLMVKLATAPKGSLYSQNNNSVRTVATTYLNISLEPMSPDVYRRALMQNPMGIGVGPLVPVISLGQTVPGEQMQNNRSVMGDLLGIFIQLSANNQAFFSEAFRQQDVGARGNIANLAQIAYQVSGRAPANNDILTTKSLSNQNTIMKFIQNYVSQRAVFVMDIPHYSERPANAEFWWNLLTHKNGTSSAYYKAFLMIIDKLSNNEFSKRGKKAMEENNTKVWRPGDDILVPTPIIVPVGTAKGKNGWFSLEEVDQMLLRDSVYYANNEQAISQYVSLTNGQSGKDLRVRQYEIKKSLEFLFSGNVSLVGWKSRWRFSDKFLNSFAASMQAAGTVTVTSNNATHIWENQISNEYLMATSTAVLQNTGVGANNIGGVYASWS